MHQYIRDFQTAELETFCVSNGSELNEVIQINKNNNNFTLLHNNIRSIARNLDEFKITFNQCLRTLDVIILTETWNIPDVNLVEIPSYTAIFNESNLNQNDGTIIYVKSCLSFISTISIINNFSFLKVKNFT